MPNTVFNIGSCTKAFTATQLAILADKKKIAWNHLVRNHLPEFRMYDPWVNRNFQIEDLLCHRSGLPFYSLFTMMFAGYPANAVVRGIQFKKPTDSFRSTFAYQNNMYVTASKLIEAKTGQAWKDNLSETIFAPLGMTRSVTTQAEKNRMNNVATGHLLMPDGALWPTPPGWPNWFVSDNALGAGAIKSTVMDMAQWMLFNLALGSWGGRQIVSAENMRYLQAPRVFQASWASGPGSVHYGPVSYGAGWQYFGLAPQPLITHDGTEPGFKSSLLLVPGADIGIVILSNIGANFTQNPALGARVGVVQKIAFRFYDLYFGRYVSQAQLDQHVASLRFPPENPESPDLAATCSPVSEQAVNLPAHTYSGIYHHPAYGRFVVKNVGGSLVVIMGPRKLRARMVPAGKDVFLAYLPGYPANYPPAHVFIDDDGGPELFDGRSGARVIRGQ